MASLTLRRVTSVTYDSRLKKAERLFCQRQPIAWKQTMKDVWRIVSNNADSNHIERLEYCTILERALQKDTNMI